MLDYYKVGGGGGCRGLIINMMVLKEWCELYVLKLYNLYKYKNGEKV